MADKEKNDGAAEEIEKQEREKSDAGWSTGIGSDVSTGGGAYIGRDFAIKGDDAYGDKVKIGRDRISFGDIKGSGGVAMGRSAQAANQSLMGDELAELFAPLMAAAASAPDEMRDEVTAVVQSLVEEAAKGGEAEDTLVAGLIERLIYMIPETAETLKSIYQSPPLANQVGPVTSYVLAKIQAG